MSAEYQMDRLLNKAYERPPPAPSTGFDQAVMERLATEPQHRSRRSPAAILLAYWVLAAVVAVMVMASVGWAALDSGVTILVVIGGLASVLGPVVVFARLANVRLTDLLFRTVED